MSTISNVDRLVVVLRQRLVERARLDSADPAKSQKSEHGHQATGFEKTLALIGADQIDDQQLRRALIENVLVEQFGQTLVNDAKFQQVIDRVTDTIKGEPALSSLLDTVVADLKRAS